MLPRLALPHGLTDVVAKPLTNPTLTRFLYTVRLDTRHTPHAIVALEQMLAAEADPAQGRQAPALRTAARPEPQK
jgi:hypothetical protein